MAKKIARKQKQAGDAQLEGYPYYPEKEDIFKQYEEKQELDPEDLSKKREADPDPDNIVRSEIPVHVEMMDVDLDVPGAEFDDKQEEVGSEDEENNYYSLGGEKDLEDQHGGEDI